ncbi:hypothetical protein AB0C14_22750 [Microbispora hainanensis]|uniref:hypothetical protein n=1 Tax=Microbispora hainanensis TaxID=568844 RepID=UPI0033C56547
MSEFVQWSDTKARIREIDPEWDSPERAAARETSREQLQAELRGAAFSVAAPASADESSGRVTGVVCGR